MTPNSPTHRVGALHKENPCPRYYFALSILLQLGEEFSMVVVGGKITVMLAMGEKIETVIAYHHLSYSGDLMLLVILAS